MRFLFCFLSVVWMSASTWADITITLDNSQATYFDGGFGFGDAVYNQAVSNTSIDADGNVVLSVTGATGTYAESIYDVQFTVDQSVSYSLAANLSSFNDVGTVFSTVTLNGPGVNLSIADPNPNFTTLGVLLSGGTYHLVAHARVDQGVTDVNGGAQFFVSLNTLAPVPEPTSLGAAIVLCLTGGGWSWRKKRTTRVRPSDAI